MRTDFTGSYKIIDALYIGDESVRTVKLISI